MIDVLLFLLGVHLTMILFADCYRVIDLWYAIGEHAAAVTLRLIIIVSVIAVTYYLVPASHEAAVLWGQIFFAAFHISVYWLGVFWIRMRSRT